MPNRAINLKDDFGAVGNGSTDDTPSINAAVAYAASRTNIPAIYVPPGNYRANTIDIPDNKQILFFGDEVGQARFTYNGPGGVGSYIFKKLNTVTGAAPWGGFKHLLFDGYNSDLNTVAVEGIDLSQNNQRLDLGFKLQDLSFRNCVNALKIGGVVNLHLDMISWYGIGQYPIYLVGDASSERRPFSISRCTWDCGAGIGGAPAAVRAASGILDSSLGFGFLYANDMSGIHLRMTDTRFEGNGPLYAATGKPCWFRIRSTDSNLATISLDNVHGYFYGDQSGIITNVESGQRVGMHMKNCVVGWCVTSYIYNPGSGLVALPYNVEEDFHWNADPRQVRGMSIGDGAFEYRSYPAGSDPNSWISFHFRKPGNIIYNADWDADADVRGWLARGEGYSKAYGQTLISNVSFLVGASTVVVAASELRNLLIGMSVKIPGAGVAAVDLPTLITDVDYDTRTVTFRDAVSTAVGPVNIVNIPHTWRSFYRTDAP